MPTVVEGEVIPFAVVVEGDVIPFTVVVEGETIPFTVVVEGEAFPFTVVAYELPVRRAWSRLTMFQCWLVSTYRNNPNSTSTALIPQPYSQYTLAVARPPP